MSLLTASQLASMRATQEEALPDTCQINGYTSAPDGGGGTIDTWGAPVTVACRLGVAGSARDGLVAGQDQNTSGWVITLPNGTAVGNRDRITITTQANRVFEVVRSLEHSWNTATRVSAMEIL